MDKLDKVAEAVRNGSAQQLIESTQQLQQRLQSERLLNRDLILWLWASMVRLYGHKWESAYGTEPDKGNVWAACLKGVTREQLQDGMRACVDLGLEWPPSAPQFVNLCLKKCMEKDGTEINWQHAQIERAENDWQQHRKSLPDLTKKERTRQAGAATLKAMKGLFS